MKKKFAIAWKILLYIFAAVGFVFIVVFIGMRFGIFNVRGSIGERNQFFTTPTSVTAAPSVVPCTDAAPTCAWNATPEWAAIKGGLQKDTATIEKVSSETGVSERMIAAVVIPEQMRFFTSDRESFKKYFEPLKILGPLTEFSLGISGIKQTTATAIETYANDPTSDYYPGPGISALIAYPPGTAHDIELYDRLTDANDHYYQYLYTAIFIKEIEAQWTKSGYNVSKEPEVIVTLFNIGFQASHPNANPQVGGAPITVGGITYAYGQLGSDFYHSSELTDNFPG